MLSTQLYAMCWHKGAIYGKVELSNQILCWKPGDAEPRAVAGEGASVAGVNELAHCVGMAVMPDGEILAADRGNKRLVSFQNGFGRVLLSDVEGLKDFYCSPNGVVYVLNQNGTAVQKLVGSTLQPFIDSKNFPEELQFGAYMVFATKEEALYLADRQNCRILCVAPGESKPVVVATLPFLPASMSGIFGIFVTEIGKVYVNHWDQRTVFALHPGDTTFTEVLKCTGSLMPVFVLVQGQSLYVSMVSWEDGSTGIYEYSLPPELQLEC